MRDYLILKLQGVMQAWGEHTFEGLRPSTNFPTRSALTGLLAACLGIDRNDRQQQQALANSFLYAVRQDETEHSVIKMTDYHTVKDAREDYVGLKSHDTIITQREYLLDAAFTVAIWNTEGAEYSLEQLKAAVCQPRYTPFLGRRSCPITRPLYESRVQAINSDEALKLIEPVAGVIYSEDDVPEILGRKPPRYKVRDVPLLNQPRQFASRMVYVYGKENADVSE
ncbi:MAG: type I-E CRISPR-associated protein Cas5/CasD [Thiothrix lacustris]|uniref:Type I-E CRISPR-associated protein Cas5/CasD n=1 Tax=Thiothrix lacustris TaxID=525917 RepID=A0A1Y1QFY6_9GAMM|nr:MAG: type I-E CRISPR-associated protein Cas5/CasD [Thiothrix lacustris]